MFDPSNSLTNDGCVDPTNSLTTSFPAEALLVVAVAKEDYHGIEFRH